MGLGCGERVSRWKRDFDEHNSLASQFCVDASHCFGQFDVRRLMPLAGIHFQSFKDFCATHSRRTLRLGLKESPSQRLYNKIVSGFGGKEWIVSGYDYLRCWKRVGDAAQQVLDRFTAFGVCHLIYLAGI